MKTEIAQACKTTSEMTPYEALLQQNQEHTLSDSERAELAALHIEGDHFMLRKAQSAAILCWRGHSFILDCTGV